MTLLLLIGYSASLRTPTRVLVSAQQPPKLNRMHVWTRATASSGRDPTVYLVRHGQSEWNLAAKRLDLWGLLSKVDHALTPEGVSQCRRLRAAVETATASGDQDARTFGAPTTRVFSSPLTRAVSTAVVSLGSDRIITLLPDARELAWPLGGPDTIGAATGDAVTERALDALCLIDAQYCITSSARAAIEAIVDTSAVQGQWWTGFRESRENMAARLFRLLRSHMSHEASVLVCHSKLIRRLFLDFASTALIASKPELLTQLRSRKLNNCGVVRAQINDEGLLANAELVFGSRLL